jgi:hypothetical protein
MEGQGLDGETAGILPRVAKVLKTEIDRMKQMGKEV